ncbi:uncharacterized protein E0L32_004754 [Thyridium curvatum]|uniref:Integral membrane protein n=1 Tax=Thyridium curvatum TaxID=1093900 RepID=A0A507B7U1_9PEZI|nr:uncharacterized protein E0L32_004754 [Thyridium curvatum]TPX15196.1 hypothetical protein E0L32_004754 [Thyridium curvatum]
MDSTNVAAPLATSVMQTRPGMRTLDKIEQGIPPVLRPLLRAYLLGYASAVAPRLLTLMLQHLTRRRRGSTGARTRQKSPFPASFKRISRMGLELQRFPTFCAALVGGSTLLQSKETPSFTDTVVAKSDVPPGVRYKKIRYAGRTLDLTLFASTRAVDVIVGELWSQRKARRLAAGKWTKTEVLISKLADPAMFATSCALIMWTWIYLPARLPRAYNKWIGSAAAVDIRLIQALQRCRTGELRYGEDTGQAPLLEGMCADYYWPLEWGDPARSVPFPCEMVHMGCGPSCEYHALDRFYRSFRWSMATYLPLNLLLVLRRPNRRALLRALLSASRSSAFLGAFITLFYYGVCLARTRLGPRLLGADHAARQRIDGGICVGTGCALCGWSILIENAGRRKDMALFVAPRALATLLPRRYAWSKQWRETLVFAASTAVVFTCALENRRRVRGVLGGILGGVLSA